MFSSLLYVAVALTAPAGQSGPLLAQMEICPEKMQLGDVLLVKITVMNVGDEPVPLPLKYNRVWATLRYDLTHYRSRYSFQWSNDLGHAFGLSGTELLPPKQSRVLVWDALELPPISHVRRDFWSELTRMGKRPFLKAGMCQEPTPRLDALVQGPQLEPRPEEEVEHLLEVYAQHPPDPMIYGTRALPVDFGLWSFPEHMATPEKLGDLEKKLSAGTLRDVIQVTRLMQVIAITGDDVHSKDDAERQASTRELISLLDSSPELERDWLGQRALRWFDARTTAPDEIEKELVKQIIKRLPETLVDEVMGHASATERH